MGFVDSILSDDPLETGGFKPIILGEELSRIADEEERQKQRQLQQARDAEPTRSALGEVGTGLLNSVRDSLPEMAAGSLAAIAAEGSTAEEWALKQRAVQREDAQLPSHMLQPDRHNWVTNSLASGAQSIAPTLAVAATSMVSPWVGAPMAALLFGGSSYQDAYDEVFDETGDKTLAHEAGLKVGALQGLPDAGMSLVGGRFLKAATLGLGKKTVTQTLGKLKNPTAIKNFTKDAGKMFATEVPTEILQDTSSEAIKAGYTGKEVDYLGIVKDTGSATLGMTALMLPFGGIGHIKKSSYNKRLLETVESDKATTEQRLVAAATIYGELEGINKADAQQWATATTAAINAGKPLDITQPLAAMESPTADLDAAREDVAAQGGDALDQAAAAPSSNQADATPQTVAPIVEPTINPIVQPQFTPEAINGPVIPEQQNVPEAMPVATDEAVRPPDAAPYVVTASGKPFQTEKGATAALKSKKLNATHEVIKLDNNQYALKPMEALNAETTTTTQGDQTGTTGQVGTEEQNGQVREEVAVEQTAAPMAGEAIPPAVSGRTEKQLANDAKLSKERNVINYDNDDILKAISKAGGLDFAQVDSEWGKTISDASKELNKRGVFGKPVLRKKNGIPLDRMVENLKEHGYLPQDADINSLLEAVSRATRGESVMAVGKEDANLVQQEQEYLADNEETLEIADTDFNPADLEALGYNDLSDQERESYEDLVYQLDDEGFLERLSIKYEGVNDEEYYREANKDLRAEIDRRAEVQRTLEAGAEERADGTGEDGKVAEREAENAVVNPETAIDEPLIEKTEAGDQEKLFATPSTFGKKAKKGTAATNDDMHFNDLQDEAKQDDMFGGAVETATTEETSSISQPEDIAPTEAPISQNEEIVSSNNSVISIEDIPADLTIELETMDETGATFKAPVNAREAYQQLTEQKSFLEVLQRCVSS